MDHQDHTIVILRGKSKQPPKKVIKPRNNVDLHAIKLENDHDTFKIATIPKNISTQIAQARNSQKLTQKEMAQKLGVQVKMYIPLENGKAAWDGSTKQLVNKIQNLLKIKLAR